MRRPPAPAVPPSRAHLCLRALLLSATFVLPVVFMKGKSVTEDEIAHLPAGYSYLRTGRIVLNPMHPPLVKEICALPLLFLGLDMPVDRDTLPANAADVTYQRKFGGDFLVQPGRDRAIFWGRVPAVLLSVALAMAVAKWAAELWGPAGGTLALFLYAFDPTINAHAQLVTTDLGFALFATLFLHQLRRYLREPRRVRLIASGAALGLALGAKFSALVLVPLAAVLLFAVAWIGDGADGIDEGGSRPHSIGSAQRGRPRRIASACGTILALAAVAYLVLWLVYLCPADPLFYLRGLRTLGEDNDPRYLNFLMGEFRPGRWPAYLTIAWLVKTPLPSLILIAAAVTLAVRGTRSGWIDELFVAAPPLVLLAAYSLFAAPSGIRYLIPCFPFLFVFAARAAVTASRAASLALSALLTWYVVEFAAISPDQLSYFNQIAGGPSGGVRWLDESNVDWGQGLIQLRSYLDDHPLERYRLCCFGCLDPGSYGLDGEPILVSGLLSPPPGTLILSAHCVARARAWLAQRHGEGPGNWLAHQAPTAIVGHAYYVYEIGR